jgi:hypothetical protein
MTARAWIAAALLAAAAAAPALVAGEGMERGAEGLVDPLPFDHTQHAGAFESAAVTCVDCHPVGLAMTTPDGLQPPEQALEPPLSSCHGCHMGDWKKAPRGATSSCATCHANLMSLTPADHGAGWLERHAPAARSFGARCEDCHQTSWCFECHEDRGPLVIDPHPPGFAATHGVEARVDPMSCSSCHAADACAQCHTSGVNPW